MSSPPPSSPASRKLCLIVVDSLRTDMLLRAVADDLAPDFAALLERGSLIGDCVSAFPSVTPVACSEIATGVGPDRHRIAVQRGRSRPHPTTGGYTLRARK